MNELIENPALRLFAICYLVLILKMMAVGMYTSMLRIRRGVYAAPEDYAVQGVEPRAGTDEDIERVRRAHRNDLENILPFFGVGLIYALSGPTQAGAWICFVGYTVARVLHSVFYIRHLMPHRTIAFTAGAIIALWMLLSSAWSLLT